MVCAMHRLFQSEEDDRIMEGESIPTSCEEEPPKTKELGARQGPLTTALPRKIIKSLGRFIKTRNSRQY